MPKTIHIDAYSLYQTGEEGKFYWWIRYRFDGGNWIERSGIGDKPVIELPFMTVDATDWSSVGVTGECEDWLQVGHCRI